MKWGHVTVTAATFKQLLAAKRVGIKQPLVALQEARRAGIPYALACAVLTQESGGGANVFGHDPTIFCGAGKVTKRKYLAYKAQRGRTRMQGVGPMQLTWYATQDRADQLGGCWQPRINMRVGFAALAANVKSKGLGAGVAAYNGSGPAAQRYSQQVLARYHTYLAKGLAEPRSAPKPKPKPKPKPRPKLTVRQRALHNLTGKLGVREAPSGSNRCWASAWYGFVGPWCAMSACWAYATAGSKTITLNLARRYGWAGVPRIVADARAHRHGLSTTKTPIPGDLVCYDWQRDGLADHVGIFEKWIVRGKTFSAIEGNTSLSGSQSNGGQVCRQRRDVSLVACFVRVSA